MTEDEFQAKAREFLADPERAARVQALIDRINAHPEMLETDGLPPMDAAIRQGWLLGWQMMNELGYEVGPHDEED